MFITSIFQLLAMFAQLATSSPYIIIGIVVSTPSANPRPDFTSSLISSPNFIS